jgi:hypothetical protein
LALPFAPVSASASDIWRDLDEGADCVAAIEHTIDPVAETSGQRAP